MRTIITVLALSLALAASGASPPKDAVADSDRVAIEAVIKKQTDLKILGMTKQSDGTVRVTTGVIRGPRDGGGHVFILKRTKSGWTIQSKKDWVS